MIRTPLSATDAADRAQYLSLFVRVLIFGMPLVMVGESLAWARGWFNGWVLLLLFLLNIPLLFLATGFLYGMMERAAAGLS